jgi:deazaflavin-dependent oxidoreductase (nitroreductase family)
MSQQSPDHEALNALNAFNAGIVDEFRANAGKVGGPFANADLLLLHTTGAKSGQPRISPLAYFRIGGKLIIVGSFAGAPVSPAWVHNLRADPAARVDVGSQAGTGIQTFEVTARELPPAERDEIFATIVAAAPGFAEYQAKTSRVIPLFELHRA